MCTFSNEVLDKVDWESMIDGLHTTQMAFDVVSDIWLVTQMENMISKQHWSNIKLV